MARSFFTVDLGADLRKTVEKLGDGLKDNVRAAIDAAGRQMQNEARAQTLAGGLGDKIAKSWRLQGYPENKAIRTLHPRALVWSKAPSIAAAFDLGATIVSTKGRYLLISTREAQAVGFPAHGSQRYPAARMIANAIGRYGKLREAPLDDGSGYLLLARLRRQPKGLPLFILKRQITLPRRYTLKDIMERAAVTAASMIGW